MIQFNLPDAILELELVRYDDQEIVIKGNFCTCYPTKPEQAYMASQLKKLLPIVQDAPESEAKSYFQKHIERHIFLDLFLLMTFRTLLLMSQPTFQISWNDAGALLVRLPGDLRNKENWKWATYRWSVKEGVHQRTLDLTEAIGNLATKQ